ncbi:MAG: MFS transporter [Aliihoeflea sp.]
MTTARDARRTAIVLAAAQAIVGSAAPIAISVGGLAGYYLLGSDKSLATAPVTGFTIGVALGAIPAAMVLRRLGLRHGFMTGTGMTASGGVLATLALFAQNFWLFAAGLALIGIGNAFVQQFRFAAAESAPAQFKARAISFVLAGGVLTAIIGPQIVIFTRELLAPVMFAGTFASVLGIAAVGALILSALPRNEAGPFETAASDGPARSLGEIVRQPKYCIGLLCGVGTYALMSFVMTGAPLAMVGCGFSTDQAMLGISWHVMAMYAPSFFTGKLIARFGKEKIVAAGLVLLLGCAVVALSGIELWQFWTALVLLGIGWNFGFIGSTAMVAETYRGSEKGKALGFHDFALFSTVAFASFMSGLVYNLAGWEMLNWIVFPVSAICLASLALLAVHGRRHAAGAR